MVPQVHGKQAGAAPDRATQLLLHTITTCGNALSQKSIGPGTATTGAPLMLEEEHDCGTPAARSLLPQPSPYLGCTTAKVYAVDPVHRQPPARARPVSHRYSSPPEHLDDDADTIMINRVARA